MAQAFCPYVGALDGKDREQPAVAYPSFENHCLATDKYEPVLLTDQATFCLGNGHRYCPRYQAATGPMLTGPAFVHATTPPLEKGQAAASPHPVETAAGDLAEDLAETYTNHRQLWHWVGAGLFFLSIFLCGGVFAAYTGWQLVSANLSDRASARVNTIAIAPTPAPPVYIVLTATSGPPATAPAANPAVATSDAALPVAVTPTPIVVAGDQLGATPAAGVPENALPTLPPADQATLPVDLSADIPTRRPTPELDIPTSTPTPEVTTPPTLTPTPSPPPGTPVVQFGPVDQLVLVGQCTVVQWHVENVRAVYYNNQPVQGDGSQEECIKKNPKTYKLAVALFDGSTKVYSTTIVPLFPTDTVTPTPSFTPEIIPTATWTPIPPTATPTPDIHYATTLEVQGDDPHSCAPGATCEIGLLVTNSGDATDNLTVTIVQGGPWSPTLCRTDGVCSSSNLSINNISPTNTAFIKFTLSIPANAGGQQQAYGVRSVSNGSSSTVMSEIASFSVQIK